MPARCILVADVGTQSLRASLIGEDGTVLCESHEAYRQPYRSPQSGFAEQDADFYFDVLCARFREIFAKRGDLAEKATHMAIATFRDSAVLLSEEGRPLRPMILWLDQRLASPSIARKIPWKSKLLFRLCGMWQTAEINARRTAAMWVKENQPELWAKVDKYVPLGAYLNLRLTGRLACSDSDVVGHYPFDYQRKRWYPKGSLRQPLFGIDPSMAPALVKTGQILGEVTGQASLLTGIPQGVKLVAVGSDKACEVFGDGCVDPSFGAISLGTACTVDIPMDRYASPEPFLPAYGAAYPGGYNDEVQIYRGFWLIKWYADNFASAQDVDQANEEGLPVECLMDRRIEGIAPGADGLLVQPYWGPGLTRPFARGAMIGFRDSQTKYHIYRATIEGIAFALREGLEGMEKRLKVRVKNLVVSGGGSRSDAVGKIVADALGRPVKKVLNPEATSLGAAMAGFLAQGVFSSPQEAVSRMVRYAKTIQPDPSSRSFYDRLYRRGYLEIFPRLDGLYQKLDDLTRGGRR